MINCANTLDFAPIGRVAQRQSVAFTQRTLRATALRFSTNPDSAERLCQQRVSSLATAVQPGRPTRARAVPRSYGPRCDGFGLSRIEAPLQPLVERSGIRYVCRYDLTSRGVALRCGQCLRGRVERHDCRVCGATQLRSAGGAS